MTHKTLGIRLRDAVYSAIRPALKNILWLLKLMLPISLGIAIAQYLGIIAWLSIFLSPVMGVIGLEGSASLVFITAIFANIYSAIAVLANLNLGYRSVTILATMCLIAHNMIVETLIQKKTGSSAIYMVVLRIGAALIGAYIINAILPSSYSGTLHLQTFSNHADSWTSLMSIWIQSQIPLIIKVVWIVSSLQILQSILKEFQLIDRMTYPLKPLVIAMGMKAKMTFMWIVANTLGLGYGGAVLYDEVQKNEYTAEEVTGLNTSIAITHSLLEDTILFAVIGIAVPWLIIPRMVLSTAALWLERFVRSRIPIFAYHKDSR